MAKIDFNNKNRERVRRQNSEEKDFRICRNCNGRKNWEVLKVVSKRHQVRSGYTEKEMETGNESKKKMFATFKKN